MPENESGLPSAVDLQSTKPLNSPDITPYEDLRQVMDSILPNIYQRVRKMPDFVDVPFLHTAAACSELSYLSSQELKKNGVQAEVMRNEKAAYPSYVPADGQPNHHMLVAVELPEGKHFIDATYGQFLAALGVQGVPYDQENLSPGGARAEQYIIFPATQEGAKQVVEWMINVVRINIARNKMQMPPNATSRTIIPISEMRELLLMNYDPANYLPVSEQSLRLIRQNVETAELVANNLHKQEMAKPVSAETITAVERELGSFHPTNDKFTSISGSQIWDALVTPSSLLLTTPSEGKIRANRYTVYPDGRGSSISVLIDNISELPDPDYEKETPSTEGAARNLLAFLKEGKNYIASHLAANEAA